MEQKKMKTFREKLLQKKQEILEAYNKNKTYGKEADEDGAQDIADKASNSYTKEFLFSLSNSERDMLQLVDEALDRIEDKRFGVCVVLRGRDEPEAPGGRALGPATASPARRSRSRASSERPRIGRRRPEPRRGAGLCPPARRPRAGRGLPRGVPGLRGAGRPSHPRAPLRRLLGGAAAAPGAALRAAASPCRGPRALRALPPRALARSRAGASLGPYEGSLRVLLHELKYRGPPPAWPRGWRRRCSRSPPPARCCEGADVLVPVPLHPRRRRERGFNQAELLAAELGASHGAWPCSAAPWCGARTRCPRPASPPPPAGGTWRGLRGAAAGAGRGARRGAGGRRPHHGRDRARLRARAAGGGGRRGAAPLGGAGALGKRGRMNEGGTGRTRVERPGRRTIEDAGTGPDPRRGLSRRPPRRGAWGGTRRHQAVVARAIETLPKPPASPSTRTTGWRSRPSPSSRPSPRTARSGASRSTSSCRSRSPTLPHNEAAIKSKLRRAAAAVGRLALADPGVLRPARGGLQARGQGEDPDGVGHPGRARGRPPQPPGPHRERRRPEDGPARPLGPLRAKLPEAMDKTPEGEPGRRELPRRPQGVRVLR